MGKYESIQIGKTISAYGGVGSLIQTRDNGSLLINDYDQWPVFINFINNKQPDEIRRNKVNIIEESRLRKLLIEQGFSSLELIFTPPVNVMDGFKLKEENKVISAQYFPKWFFCPYCRHLAHIENWRTKWNASGFTLRNRNGNNVHDQFDYKFPRCHYCRTKAENNHYKRKTYFLEQVRFVLACETTGDLIDLPWDQYIYFQRAGLNTYQISHHNRRAEELLYSSSAGTAALYGIQIKEVINGDTRNIGARKSLGDILSLRFNKDGNVYQAAIRGGSNLYFAHTLSSIFVPIYYPDQHIIDQIRLFRRLRPNANAQEIHETITEENGDGINISAETINRVIDANFNFQTYVDEINDFRKEEIEYITSHDEIIEGDLVSKRALTEIPEMPYIIGLYSLRKLKETSVQTGYTRISDGKEGLAGMKLTCSGNKQDIRFLPGVENYGEGFLLEFNKENFIGFGDCETFVHTLSHVIMKELEFECGYSLTSLKERLYIIRDNDYKITKLGLLIYSINGADGSFGGITSLVPVKLIALISNAIERAKDCPNDPICSSENGHCFACTDVPEISCEKFNEDLDRNILNGFFEHMNQPNN